MIKKQQLGIRELAEKAKKENMFDLAQGVIDAPPPAALVDAFKKMPISKISKYNNKRGVQEYREAIVDYLASRNWSINIDSIMSTAGAMGGITSALLTDLKPGATILLPEPFFVYHKLLLETLGFKVKFFPTPIDAQPDWNNMKIEMGNVDAIVLTTPANPTGQTASNEVIKKLSEVAVKENCLLVLDEMYREFIWDEKTPDDSSYSNINLEKTVVCRSFSKSFAIPGWRIAFAVTSPKRIEQMAIRHDALYIGGSTIAQNAIARAINNNLEELNSYVINLRQTLQNNMELLREAFSNLQMQPLPVPAAYYMMIKHNRKSDIDAVYELFEKKIATTPMSILYNDTSKDTGYIRIHFAVKQEVAKSINKLLS